jgi:hypothetical protein
MKKWIIGAALAGIGGLTLVLLFSEEKTVNKMPLSRTVMFSIMKELRRELVGPLISLANLSLSIRAEMPNLSKSDLKEVIERNCSF